MGSSRLLSMNMPAVVKKGLMGSLTSGGDGYPDGLCNDANGINSNITLIQNLADLTPTITDDFSSASNWNLDSTTTISSNALNFEIDGSGGINQTNNGYRTLTSSVSNSFWTMEFKLTISSYTASGNTDQNTLYIGLTDTADALNNSQDFLGLAISGNSGSEYICISRDSGQPADAPTPTGASFSRSVQAETVYVRMIRNSSTLEISLFSDADFSTLLETQTQSISGTVQNLDNIQFLTLHGNTTGSPELDGKVENLEIFDGVVGGDVKVGSGCYSFNGTDSEVNCGSASDWEFLNDKSTDWSIAFWAINKQGTTTNAKNILATVDNGGSSDGLGIDTRTSQGVRVFFQFDNGSKSGTVTWNSVIPTSTTEWFHLSFVCNASAEEVSLYKNGSLVSTQSVGGDGIGSGGQTDSPLCLGARVDTYYYEMFLDDMLLATRKLTTDEISDLADGNAVSTLSDKSGIVAYYNFDSTTSTDGTANRLQNEACP